MSVSDTSSKTKKSEGESAETVSFLSGKALEKFEAYRAHDAFHPSNARVLGFFAFVAFLVYLIIWLLDALDQAFLPGLRNIPRFLAAYIVLCVIRLWIECEWALGEGKRRGLRFEERGTLEASRKREIEKLRKKLEAGGDPVMAHGRQPNIVCLTGYGGGGHEATLAGVREVMAEAGFKPTLVDVPVTYLVETSEKNMLWYLYRVTGEQLYNWALRQSPFVTFIISWTLSWLQFLALRFDENVAYLLSLLGIKHGDEASKLCGKVWSERQPDMVLNLTTGTSRTMGRGLSYAGLTHVPMVMVISDFEGVGVHSWIECETDYVVCGTSLCRQQALQRGIDPSKVYQTSGMILRPSFYDAVDIGPDRGAALASLGLDPSRRTVLIFWGGVGSTKVAEAGRALLTAREKLNLIFLCGRNKQLLEQTKAYDWPCKVVIEGFTNRVSFYMQLSDMIVCKPGPGVASEAAYLGLPILVEWTPFTLPQEVPVCKWVLSRGLGLGFSRLSQVPRLVDLMCDLLGPFQTNRRLRPIPLGGEGLTGVDMNPADNKAVFEVPDIINRILLEKYPNPSSPTSARGASAAAPKSGKAQGKKD